MQPPGQQTDQQLGYLVKRAQNELRTVMERMMADRGLTMSRYAALVVLDEHGAQSSAALARRCFVTPQTMTRLVRDLEDRGLIVRRTNPDSGREVLAELTTDGRAVLSSGHGIADAVHDLMLDGLDADDRDALRTSLHRIIDNLA